MELPVVDVSWTDAQAFCAWLAAETRNPWRLPSEAEWEIACRAGTDTPFSTGWGLSIEEANFLYDEEGERIGPGRRTAMRSYPANPWGLRDMHGNVCEWCADAWHPSHERAASDGSPRIGAFDADRVIRGGAWDLLPRLLRSSWRDGLPPQTRRDNLGFRLAVTLD
jgi:formylglycine-generating enzyme required for sulfatase activity